MTNRIARIVGLLAVAALLVAACGDDSDQASDADPLALDGSETLVFEVTVEVTEASEEAGFAVGETFNSCYALSADGSFEDARSTSSVPGTWESDGTDSSFVAEIEGAETTWGHTGSVTVDENGGRELTGETTVSSGDTIVLRGSTTGLETDIDDVHASRAMCLN